VKIKYTTKDFTFPIVNFPFINSNIIASPAYGVFISQLIRYPMSLSQCSDFLIKFGKEVIRVVVGDYIIDL
jgi:hypothetical protein